MPTVPSGIAAVVITGPLATWIDRSLDPKRSVAFSVNLTVKL